ncbi:MAG: alpha/beta hydrolase-fold protein [Lachnoclostridium sp.]
MTPTEYMQAVRKLVTEKEASGITDERAGVDYGTLRKYTYYSTTAERDTNVNVLLPAGYSEEEEYPVLYVLHGYWGTEDALLDAGDASLRIQQIIGNLTAQGEAEKMIVVFPYIYCSKDQQYCSGLDLANSLNYDNFINDLTTDLMPFIEENFAAATGSKIQLSQAFLWAEENPFLSDFQDQIYLDM